MLPHKMFLWNNIAISIHNHCDYSILRASCGGRGVVSRSNNATMPHRPLHEAPDESGGSYESECEPGGLYGADQ